MSKPTRDALIESLTRELAEACETIGVLTERVDWYRSCTGRDPLAGAAPPASAPEYRATVLRLVPPAR
jgi:hypothetical protein